mmetsp:Transcript_12380/g.37049  ORF Transcript_12380/g.37049 Transcript_12380/m.37049 type:complete len:243 (-) Transcript_12380:496-1224(-)
MRDGVRAGHRDAHEGRGAVHHGRHLEVGDGHRVKRLGLEPNGHLNGHLGRAKIWERDLFDDDVHARQARVLGHDKDHVEHPDEDEDEDEAGAGADLGAQRREVDAPHEATHPSPQASRRASARLVRVPAVERGRRPGGGHGGEPPRALPRAVACADAAPLVPRGTAPRAGHGHARLPRDRRGDAEVGLRSRSRNVPQVRIDEGQRVSERVELVLNGVLLRLHLRRAPAQVRQVGAQLALPPP